MSSCDTTMRQTVASTMFCITAGLLKLLPDGIPQGSVVTSFRSVAIFAGSGVKAGLRGCGTRHGLITLQV